MCGIVAYFGSAGNGLTRVLAGMASIIYRAPDSTGLGLFGDDLEPIRARKSIGSVYKLIEVLLREQAHPNQAGLLLGLWTSQEGDFNLAEAQQRLLTWEGFASEGCETAAEGERKYLSFDELTDVNNSPPIGIEPGYPGRPDSLPSFFISSRTKLKEMIRELIVSYDIPPIVTETLIRGALSRRLEDWPTDERFGVERKDILEAFDELFEQILWEDKIADSKPARAGGAFKNPYTRRRLWKLLGKITVAVPEDYDRDGVRCLFRLLDASLLSRLSHHPELLDLLQKILEALWPAAKNAGKMDWRTLYRAEKGLNVYGRAAAAALTYLREREFRPEPGPGLPPEKPSSKGPPADSIQMGRTDPICLSYFCSPIVSHGRWAMQSPVTLRNAHPFFDERRRRAIVLNGQFNGEVETELREFLLRTGFFFRSENSSEYMALLWGYYFDTLKEEKRRYEVVRSQLDAGLEDFCIGSRNIDYKIYQWLKGKSDPELDELAFIEAARQIVRRGGQMAVSGLSLVSPHCLYVSGHNRPVFIVRRLDNEDVMVVSDINAAMGLFPQSLLLDKGLELRKENSRYRRELEQFRGAKAHKEHVQACNGRHQEREAAILESFKVTVLPLEGEEVFARLETTLEGAELRRRVEVTDFSGEPLPALEEFQTVLNPLQTKKDLFKSFFETHLQEIPERLNDNLGMHLPEEETLPRLDIKLRHMRRRFGPGFAALKRIILVGMGSSYHVGLMAKTLFHELIPQIDIIALRPVEVDHIPRFVDPERDLVVLLSWSGITADMVEFARDLGAHKVTMVGITDRPFSEMALIARRSGGVIKALSGEEVTVSAIKSPVCLLFSLDLLAVWLATGMGSEKKARKYMKKLRRLPGTLQKMIDRRGIEDFSMTLAAEKAASRAFVIIDALYTTGTGREASLKLEENSLSAIGKALDYRDVLPGGPGRDWSRDLVLVSATTESRLEEALDVMKLLYLAGIPFAAVSYEHQELEQVRFYSRGLNLVLPKAEDALQPFIDLMFYYSLTYHYGLLQGPGVPGFPRNRAKSVTTARSRPGRALSPAAELMFLEKAGRLLNAEPPPDLSGETAWEGSAFYDWEKKHYQEMRLLAAILSEEDSPARFFQSVETDFNKLAEAIFDNLAEGGEIVLICLDREARAAAGGVAAQWSRLVEGLVRVTADWMSLAGLQEDTAFLIVASEPPEDEVLHDLTGRLKAPVLWVGPSLPRETARFFSDSLGCFVLSDNFQSARNALIYAGLHLIMLTVWKTRRPGKAEAVRQLLKACGRVIQAVLNDTGLRKSIVEAMAANRAYETAFYIGPPGGIGLEWVDRFDRIGSPVMESHLFGDSAHGPLATVDPNAEEKFVRVQARQEMASIYGEDLVSEWEGRFLKGRSFDSLLDKPAGTGSFKPVEPFFTEGYWYLPVLRPGYDTARDNLIIIDAAGERYFDQALDELGTYGCRYARLLVISQEVFRDDPDKRGLYSYPIGCLVLLPALRSGGQKHPVPDMLLPFAATLLAAAAAAAAAKERGLLDRPPAGKRDLLREAFGLLGDIMVRHSVRIHHLNHNLIEAIKNVAPLVAAIEGMARFGVRRVGSEQELLDLDRGDRLYGGRDIREHFRVQADRGVPFFLVHPDKEFFQGKGLKEGETYSEDQWNLWYEAFWDTWRGLYERRLEIRESSTGGPLIELPLLQPGEEEGLLYRFYVRFLEWDHYLPLKDQVSITLEAMGKEQFIVDHGSTGYAVIVSSFNEAMVGREVLWDDWLIALAPRSWLFRKRNEEMAHLLAERAQAILDLKATRSKGMDDIPRAIEAVWQDLQEIDSGCDDIRWPAMYEAVKKFLLGGKSKGKPN